MQISEYNVHDPDVVLMNNNLPRITDFQKRVFRFFRNIYVTVVHYFFFTINHPTFYFFFLKQKLCRCSFIIFIFLHSMINDQLKLIKDTIE